MSAAIVIGTKRYLALTLALVVASACGTDAAPANQPANQPAGQAVSPDAARGAIVVGLGVRDLQPIDLQRTGGTELRGAYIGMVMPGSPAERVGLRVGDVVLEANQQPIANAEELKRQISAQRGGGVLELTIRRAGQTLRVIVTARQESGRIG